jgi:hypothetical protein
MFTLVDLDYLYINIFKPAIQEWKKGICPIFPGPPKD